MTMHFNNRLVMSSFLSNLTLITKLPNQFLCQKVVLFNRLDVFRIQNCHINNYLSL